MISSQQCSLSLWHLGLFNLCVMIRTFSRVYPEFIISNSSIKNLFEFNNLTWPADLYVLWTLIGRLLKLSVCVSYGMIGGCQCSVLIHPHTGITLPVDRQMVTPIIGTGVLDDSSNISEPALNQKQVSNSSWEFSLRIRLKANMYISQDSVHQNNLNS